MITHSVNKTESTATFVFYNVKLRYGVLFFISGAIEMQ